MRHYPSKAILFGEYSVLLGSQVLGVPLVDRYGYWSTERGRNSKLTYGFIDYLLSDCSDFLDTHKVQQIADGHLFYRSTIKRGYGTGSSGAISAAIYDYCAISPADDHDISSLRQQLSAIESFFHGKSSGFDPLISIKASPILRDQQGNYSLIDADVLPRRSISKLSLLDSGGRRKVKGLVPRFIEMNREDPSIGQQLVELNNNIIRRLLIDEDISQDLANLSAFQLEHMRPMIIDQLASHWQRGLESGDYFIKLCGTGGGGYYLIYIINEDVLNDQLPYQLVPLAGL
jgi:mevalonate kinase